MIKANSKAPDFRLPDETGKTVRLKDLRDREVVLFFYSKANSPG